MLDTNERKKVTYFVGDEVEHTIAYGKRTLFVVGIVPFSKCIDLAKWNNCDHIYFGTSQSFNPATYEDWTKWDEMITEVLDAGYWVTLDFDVKHADLIHENGWCENDKFIPMISVKLPAIKLYNYNATLKIDDITWGHSNPGVWTHQLHDLMDKSKYTYWDQYTNDTTIEG